MAAVSPKRAKGPVNQTELARSTSQCWPRQAQIDGLTLEEGSTNPRIVSAETSIIIENFGCFDKRVAEAILVVHNGAEWL